MDLNLRKMIEEYLLKVGWKKDLVAKEDEYGVLREFYLPSNEKRFAFYEAIWEQEFIEESPEAIGEKKNSNG